MMMSEFIERTGFEPSAEEYENIEEQYYNFDGDKDAENHRLYWYQYRNPYKLPYCCKG